MTIDEWLVFNRRRGELINREIAGTITLEESVELKLAQVVADEYLDCVSPRPTGELDRLEKMLGLTPM